MLNEKEERVGIFNADERKDIDQGVIVNDYDELMRLSYKRDPSDISLGF